MCSGVDPTKPGALPSRLARYVAEVREVRAALVKAADELELTPPADGTNPLDERRGSMALAVARRDSCRQDDSSSPAPERGGGGGGGGGGAGAGAQTATRRASRLPPAIGEDDGAADGGAGEGAEGQGGSFASARASVSTPSVTSRKLSFSGGGSSFRTKPSRAGRDVALLKLIADECAAAREEVGKAQAAHAESEAVRQQRDALRIEAAELRDERNAMAEEMAREKAEAERAAGNAGEKVAMLQAALSKLGAAQAELKAELETARAGLEEAKAYAHTQRDARTQTVCSPFVGRCAAPSVAALARS